MKINIVGYGINPANDLTLQGLQILRSGQKVLAVAPAQDIDALRGLGITIEDIFNLYVNGRSDTENYDAIFARILHETQHCENVVVAIPGNPGVGVTIVQMLHLKQADHGYELNLVAGISSFDWMLLENERDPLERGTCILDANRLLLLDYTLNPFIDHYIYHVCSIGVKKTWIEEPKRDNKIAALKNKLLEAFPSSHQVSLVSAKGSSVFLPGSPQKSPLAKCSIEKIEDLLDVVTFDSTLFIKAMPPTRINKEFLSVLQSA